jgi:hypothetical protein
MDNQANNPPEDVELTLRKLRFLWLATLGSLAGFYVLTLSTARPENLEPNDTLFLILVAGALTTTLVSFVVKKRFFARAEEQQQVQLVQQGFIVASAITEVGALLGVLDYFSFGDRYYFVLFIIAACGQLLHFPRREPVLHATYKTTTF